MYVHIVEIPTYKGANSYKIKISIIGKVILLLLLSKML